jgi:mannose PTS system EIIA component
MLRLLIIAHAPLASAFKQVAAHIDPERAAFVDACDIRDDDSLDDAMARGASALARADGADVLILTDVFGATPCNSARQLCQRPGVRMVSGVNVPALWRAIGHLHEPLDVVTALVVAGGQSGIQDLGNAMS